MEEYVVKHLLKIVPYLKKKLRLKQKKLLKPTEHHKERDKERDFKFRRFRRSFE